MTTLSERDVSANAKAETRAAPEVLVERRRDVRSRSVDDRLSAPGAAISALALVWLVFTYVLPWSGWVGFALCWVVTFLVVQTALTLLTSPRPIVVYRLMASTVT